MKNSLLTFLFFTLFTTLTQAQKIEPGYLVVSRGDTLRGEVENAFWEDPPTTIRFRATPTDRLVSYSAHHLRSVYLASGRLLRHELLPIDRAATTNINQLRTSLRSYQQPDSVLADVLVLGPATLLGITLHAVKHFFVRREAQPYLEMTERNYLASRQGTTRVADGNDYKGQLLVYFGDCEAATKAAAQAPFTAKGLKTVVQAYNQRCSAGRRGGQEITDSTLGRTKVAVQLGVVAGLRYNALRFSSTENAALDGFNADGQVHVLGGGYLDLAGAGRRLGLHTALLVSRFGRSGPVVLPAASSTSRGRLEWRGTLTSLQVGLRGFRAVGQHDRLLFGGGVELNTLLVTASDFSYIQHQVFLDGLPGWLLPYLEVGFNRSRSTLVLMGRLYGTQSYSYYDALNQPAFCKILPWSLSIALSYRLNANSDTK